MSKTASWTPGPWRIVIDDDGNPLSGRPSVQSAPEYDCGIVHWDGFVQDYWRSARGDKEIHANARLIAAAPESHEANREAVDFLRSHFGPVASDDPDGWSDDDARQVCKKLEAAIAKATGSA